MLNPEQGPLAYLKQYIRQVSKQHLSCSLTLHPLSTPPLQLIFKLGRLVWATGGEHRFRRWNRLTKIHLPSVQQAGFLQALPPGSKVWEYQLLMQLLQQNKISRNCASQLIQACLQEVLFEAFQLYPVIQNTEIEPLEDCKAIEPLIFPSVEDVLRLTAQEWQSWQTARLIRYNPNASPCITNPQAIHQQAANATTQNVFNLLQGQFSVRDLSHMMQQPVRSLIQRLQQYEAKHLILFRPLPDCASPLESASQQSKQTSTSEEQSKPLIYCIDDSVNICNSLKLIIEKQGYRFLSAQDPFKALQDVIEQKPALIFIDLIMPIISGYDVCTQIRRIQSFQDTPLIILTSNDGVVDRVRSKLVGATEFASKPVTMQRIAPLLQKYVPLESEDDSAYRASALSQA